MIFDNTPDNNQKNTHVINVFLEIFKYYDIYREDLEPYYTFEKSFDEELLPPGSLSDSRNFGDLVSIVSRHINEEEIKPLIQRLDVFKEFSPKIRHGQKGYSGYVALVFEDKNIVAAESIKRNNATYFFKQEDYEDNILKNKQEVINNKLMLVRFAHSENWEQKVRKFLNEH